MKRIKRIFIGLFFYLGVLFVPHVNAQKNVSAEKFEQIFSYWYKGLETARVNVGAGNCDYMAFQRFYEAKIDTIRAGFMRQIGSGGIDSTNVKTAMALQVIQLSALYDQFKQVMKGYPSSVDEYKHPMPRNFPTGCDTTGCTNIGFEQGTLNGWNAFYAYNNNTGTFSFFNIANITGGPVGAVTEAANDVLTSTSGFYNTGLGPNPSPDYQISITSGTRGDALVPSVPVVSPVGGQYSAMVGDSTQVNFGVAILSKTFLVSASNADFTYEYAVFLENPSGHSYYEQPFFQVAILDQNGDTIPFCGEYQVVSSQGGVSGFNPVYVPPNGTVGNDTAYYKDWTVVSVPLKKYIGQCVTIVFETGDCSKGGHFGYAYVDASCAPLQIITSSPAICGQRNVTLTGPPGFTSYKWSSNTGLSMKGDTTQIIKVDSAGTYQLIVIPVTGVACSDTLSITIKKLPGPVPVPGFTADTACTGQPTQFTNTSTPLTAANVKFYWDFYNLGVYQDSSVNPQWSFNGPGTYTVTLYETINGCGADTTIKVVITNPPVAGLVAPPVGCVGNPLTLTASGGGTYEWNTGATTKSITILPTVEDSTYTVRVTNGCADSAFAKIHIYPVKQVTACCDTTIPYGSSAFIKAAGSLDYVWMPSNTVACSTCSPTMATPEIATIYTVTGTDSNGCHSTDTVTIRIEECGNVWIPNAFTPNGDKMNEVFKPVGICIYHYTMYIFDRWGSLIFRTTDSQSWDGTVNGRKVQEDTYVYELLVTTTDLKQRTFIGNVTVVR